jgi:hypothetical protein
MKKLILLVALVTATTAWGQKTVNDPNATTRSARGFHAIEMSDGIDLYLTQGNEEAVAVSASSPEYRDKIHVDVVNGVLKIYYERQSNWGINWGNRKLRAYVSIKNIDRLSASGGADVSIENQLNATSLRIDLSGGSDLKGKIIAQTLSVSASGGSDAHISGSTDRLKIDASGGSDFHGYDLISNYCTVETSGGSDVKVTANKEINGSASGGSDVYYRGTAQSSASKSGGSSIKRVS